ncbi:uncharacterized protein LOC121379762 [Gigantopelta aegis]|uniref:uncharacterized protein LOC121379762 n=1 Tax=Gigantopelta aegis TaxID=1735272 RepID=UPI001B88AF21|nr:uncharacterized protein LOC121379762 [Gigantopelta aegis]
MDCAKQTISTDGLGFFYKFKTKRCMTFREGPKSLEKMPEYYWLNTAKENHCSNSSGLIKWKSDGRCFVTSQNEASVDDATTICRNLYKGTLAVLSNAQRIRDMNVCLKTYDVEDEYWIGLKVGRKGNVWANGKPIDKNTVWPWASTRRGGKCYLAHKYSARWKWANQACPTSIFFICDHPCNT